MASGYLVFSDFALQHMVTGFSIIQRSTYSLAGQPIAVKVSGDPQPGNNGIFYTYSDHLGSTSVMSYGYNLNGSPHPDAGAPVPGSEARYLPFGGYRSGGSGPNEVTDRGFTGQPENMDLGLYYYQARFYVPGIGRFASADSIVPDPAKPQQYNRYTYALNNPLRYTDPTGHWSCSGLEGCEDMINIWINLLKGAGDLGNELAAYFEASDIAVYFKLSNVSIMSAMNSKTVNVNSSMVSEIINEEGIFAHVLFMTLFGHELEHTRQGFIESRSVQAEYMAYKTQIELAEQWDANTNSTVAIDMLIANGSRNGHKRYLANFVDWYALGVNLDPNSHADMQMFRAHYLSGGSGYYSRIPTFPLGDEVNYQISQVTLPIRQAYTDVTRRFYNMAYWSPIR